MDCLKFSQKEGFTTAPDPLGAEDGFFADLLTAAGYAVDVGSGKQGRDNAIEVVVYRKGQTDEFLVEVSDWAGGKSVVVNGEADLFALRLRLAPLFTVAVESALDEIREMATRAFRAWHGHDSAEVCRACDPYEYEAQQRRRREAALRPASTAVKTR